MCVALWLAGRRSLALASWFWKWQVLVGAVVRLVLVQMDMCGKGAVVEALDVKSTVLLVEGVRVLMVVWALIWLLCLPWTLLLGCSSGLSTGRRSIVHTLPSAARNPLPGLVF